LPNKDRKIKSNIINNIRTPENYVICDFKFSKMSKESSIDQFKFFLKAMFQFNPNDLDFGIYINNMKRLDFENFHEYIFD